MKETYYFPHDYNASQDAKIIELLNQCGLEGLGAYWLIIELLHQQPTSEISESVLKNHIAMYYNLMPHDDDNGLVNICSTLVRVGLLVKCEDVISSHRVDANKRHREDISRERSRAGKISADRRYGNKCSTDNPTNANKERKGKEIESKGKEIKDAVKASDSILFCEYNDKGQGRCIERKGPGASKFCPEHQLKIRDKFLMKQEKKNAPDVPSLKSFS